MSMITKVIIENFQSHEYSVLNFVNGLNVIVGPSDQGKSAILRAIKWVLYNEPRGTDFIRFGATTARVTLEMNNGYSIIRERSKSKNRYEIINQEGEVSAFEGFGNDIPEEVIKAHGIPKVILDSDISSSLNIGDQLEGPFLLSESAALRAKAIGRMTGVHILDKALRDCNVDLRRENQTSERLKGELDSTVEELKKYENLLFIDKRLRIADDLIGKARALGERGQKLEALKTGIIQSENEYLHASEFVKKLWAIDDSSKIIRDSEKKLTVYKALVEKNDRLVSVGTDIKKAENTIGKLTYLDEGIRLIKKAEVMIPGYRRLFDIKNALLKLEREMGIVVDILSATSELDKVSTVVNTAVTDQEKVNKISILHVRLKENERELKKTLKAAEDTEKVLECSRLINRIEHCVERNKRLLEFKERYSLILSYISEGEKYIEKNAKDLEMLLDEYAGALKKAGKCPLCSSEINDRTVNDIIRHYNECLS